MSSTRAEGRGGRNSTRNVDAPRKTLALTFLSGSEISGGRA